MFEFKTWNVDAQFFCQLIIQKKLLNINIKYYKFNIKLLLKILGSSHSATISQVYRVQQSQIICICFVLRVIEASKKPDLSLIIHIEIISDH